MPHRKGTARQSAIDYWGTQLALAFKAGILSKTSMDTAMSGSAATRRTAVHAARKTGGAAKTPAVRALTKRVTKIQRQLNTDMSTHTFRQIITDTVRCVLNQNTVSNFPVHKADTIQTALAGLRYYDPANPATLVTASGATGTFSRQFLFSQCHVSMECKNNYQVPVHVKIYMCEPRSDTSLTPVTTFVNGMADQNNPTITKPNIYPTDSDQLKALWNTKVKTVKLYPGKSTTFSHNVGAFDFDPSDFDSHQLQFQRSFKGVSFMVRVLGDVCHDGTDELEQALSPAGVDTIQSLKYVIKYDSGTNLNDFTASNTLGPVTTALQSQVVVDNQSFSVA